MAEEPEPGPSIDRFLDRPTEEISDWRWLWAEDHEFPVRSKAGAFGTLVVWLKKLLRPLVRSPQADLWDRQRVFNRVSAGRGQRAARDTTARTGHRGRRVWVGVRRAGSPNIGLCRFGHGYVL